MRAPVSFSCRLIRVLQGRQSWNLESDERRSRLRVASACARSIMRDLSNISGVKWKWPRQLWQATGSFSTQAKSSLCIDDLALVPIVAPAIRCGPHCLMRTRSPKTSEDRREHSGEHLSRQSICASCWPRTARVHTTKWGLCEPSIPHSHDVTRI